MPTSTTNYGWQKPDVGASTDAWGGLLNTDLDGIDSTVKSVSNVASAALPSATASSTYVAKAGDTMTGALTLSQTAGIVGTTTNNNVAAGAVGEFVYSSTTTPGVTLTTNTPANITSISLTAGDWDVWGAAWLITGTGGVTAAFIAINTVSATIPTVCAAGVSRSSFNGTITPGTINTLQAGRCRISIAATTTVYLVVQAAFPSGTSTAFGDISARRQR